MKNQTTGAVIQANADNAGHFAVTGILSGRYTLIVNAKGFASATQEDVQASAHPAEIFITLAIGSLAQSVEVQANNSIASQQALSQGSLDAETVQSKHQRRVHQELFQRPIGSVVIRQWSSKHFPLRSKCYRFLKSTT